MIDDIVDMMRARIDMAGQPLMMPTETCAVIVNRIEELEKAVVDLVQHVSRADLAYSVKTETKLVFRALMDKKDD